MYLVISINGGNMFNLTSSNKTSFTVETRKHLSLFIRLSFWLFIGIGSLHAQPINPNGSFEDATTGEKVGTDITGWTLYAEGTGNAIFEIVDEDFYDGSKAFKVQILSLGTNAWDIQVVNEPFTVEPGVEYKYSIWARADQAGVLANFTIGAPVTFTEFGRFGATLSDQWQEVTFNFTTPTTASDARAPIHLGESANSSFLETPIYLDDLRIEKVEAVDVKEENPLPYRFSLNQNYPNPFNPVTNIEYTIGSQSGSEIDQLVSLKVFDILGNEVATIVNEKQAAGFYRVKFDGSGLSSGTYLYKLTAGGFADVKKLILLK
jgi:hypothetical protein